MPPQDKPLKPTEIQLAPDFDTEGTDPPPPVTGQELSDWLDRLKHSGYRVRVEHLALALDVSSGTVIRWLASGDEPIPDPYGYVFQSGVVLRIPQVKIRLAVRG